MNKLLVLINKMISEIKANRMYDAIETNKEITKILDTYRDAC